MAFLDWLKSLFSKSTPVEKVSTENIVLPAAPKTPEIVIPAVPFIPPGIPVFPPTPKPVEPPPLRLIYSKPMFQLEIEKFIIIMPKLAIEKAKKYLVYLNSAMKEYEINTKLRGAAFLAQLAHESGELRYWKELWGPTEQQKKYEPPSSLATTLGNIYPGDGYKYRGHGPIQITGRENHRKYGQIIGVDLETYPDLASTPEHGFRVAGAFWRLRGLNELADVRDFKTITKRINGGLTGYEDRLKYYKLAFIALDIT